MAELHDEQFEQSSSGASKHYPAQCSTLRKGGFVIIKGFPCKIVEMSTSKTGKHGHAKVHMVGIDIFTGKKIEDICPSTHNMDVPNVLRKEYLLTSVDPEGFVCLFDDKTSDTREDLKVPDNINVSLDDLEAMINNADNQDVIATVLKALDTECIKEIKLGNKN